MHPTVKFTRNANDEALLRAFRKRASAYFDNNNLSRKANREIRIKTIGLLLLLPGSYLLMLLGGFGPLATFMLAAVCGLTMVLIVFNISHDASHNALFGSSLLNRVLAHTLDLVGGSAYLWRITHDEIHHTYANVTGLDADLNQALPFLRISEDVPPQWYHRYQHCYAIFLYMLFTLYLVFVKDFEDFRIFPKKNSPLMERRHSRGAWIGLLLTKTIYFSYALVLPLALLPFTWYGILIAYLGVTVMMSLPLVLIQVPLHVNRESPFTGVNADGTISKSWLTNTLDNTTDYGSRNRLLNFLFGGINAHVVHHLCPGVCHVHYTALSGILKQTLQEHGRQYRDVSLVAAIRSHFLHLYDLSHQTTNPVST